MSKSLKQKPAIPLFISKLIEMLEGHDSFQFIRWLDDGHGFVILKITGFTEHILPKYFKHQNISSFIRQLNMYGFSKSRNEDWENIYTNEFFQRGNKSLLKKIQRKIPKVDARKEEILLEENLKKIGEKKQIQEILDGQRSLEKKCKDLINQNRRLMQENSKIMEQFKKNEKRKKTMMEQIIKMISFPALELENQGQLSIEFPDSQGSKNKKQTQIGEEDNGSCFDLEEKENKKLIVDDLLGQKEDFLSINDFCNIPEDSLSDGLHFD